MRGSSGCGLALLVTFAGCATEPEPESFRREVVAGVPILHTLGPAWSEEERWRFEAEDTIGATDDDLLAGRVAVTFDPEGRLTVLDVGSHLVRIYDESGALEASFGREGQGPGEFRSPFSLGWDGAGRLWVATSFDRRFAVFSDDGASARSLPRPIRGKNSQIASLVFTEGGGTFWDERNLPDGAPRPLLFDTSGVVLDSAAPIPHAEFPPGARGISMRPGTAFRELVDLGFLPRYRWAIAPDGTRWSTTIGEARLTRTDRSGDTLLVVERTHATREIGAEWRALIQRAEREANVDPAWFRRPLVQGLSTLPDGHLAVAVVDEPGEESTTLEIHTRDGVLLGAIDLGIRLDRWSRLAWFGNRLAFVALGDFDVPLVVVGRVVRPAS